MPWRLGISPRRLGKGRSVVSAPLSQHNRLDELFVTIGEGEGWITSRGSITWYCSGIYVCGCGNHGNLQSEKPTNSIPIKSLHLDINVKNSVWGCSLRPPKSPVPRLQDAISIAIEAGGKSIYLVQNLLTMHKTTIGTVVTVLVLTLIGAGLIIYSRPTTEKVSIEKISEQTVLFPNITEDGLPKNTSDTKETKTDGSSGVGFSKICRNGTCITDLESYKSANISNTYFNFANKKISDVPQDAFQKFTNMSWLSLANNPLYIPKKRPWFDSDSVKVIDISDCNLGALGPTTFKGCPLLKNVIMYGNPGCLETRELHRNASYDVICLGTSITNVESYKSANISNTYFNFANKKISDVPQDAFQKFTNMRWLSLANNPLYIPKTRPWFDSDSVKFIVISDCNLGALGPTTFKGCPFLKKVIMYGNPGCMETRELHRNASYDVICLPP